MTNVCIRPSYASLDGGARLERVHQSSNTDDRMKDGGSRVSFRGHKVNSHLYHTHPPPTEPLPPLPPQPQISEQSTYITYISPSSAPPTLCAVTSGPHAPVTSCVIGLIHKVKAQHQSIDEVMGRGRTMRPCHSHRPSLTYERSSLVGANECRMCKGRLPPPNHCPHRPTPANNAFIQRPPASCFFTANLLKAALRLLFR